MTKEEIKELKGLAASMGLYDDKNPCKRAVILGKAIKALEQESCEDCISRKTAIDALNAFADEVNQDTDIHEAIEIVLNLPPVTPQTKTGHWIDLGGGQECSECGEIQYGYDSFRIYCANCGSKNMEG